MRTIKNFLVYSKYNPETGLSKVWIKNKYGVFMGKSRLHPEDKDFASEYVGCHFAEMKAIINAYKKKKQDLQLRLKELVYFNEILMSTKGVDLQGIEARKLRKRIYILKKEIEQAQKQIDEMKEAFHTEVKHRDDGVKLLKRIYSKKNNPELQKKEQEMKEALLKVYSTEDEND